MSKPDFNNKFNKLFSDIREDEDSVNPIEPSLNIASFTWECDANGLYTQCSNEISDLLGYSPSEIIGNPLYHLDLV